jgi:hypothetical protein
LQALIISCTDEAAARTPGDQTYPASSSSAADAAASKIALASLKSSTALSAIGATDPRSKYMERIENLRLKVAASHT